MIKTTEFALFKKKGSVEVTQNDTVRSSSFLTQRFKWISFILLLMNTNFVE